LVRGSLYFRWLSANGKWTTAFVHNIRQGGEEENGKDVRNDISKNKYKKYKKESMTEKILRSRDCTNKGENRRNFFY
jgi:hypothetical protein